MKKVLLIGAIVGLIALWGYNLMAGDTEWKRDKIGNDVEYGVLIPPEQYSFAMVGDTTQKNISLDSTEYSRWYKNTHDVFYGFILAHKWYADDSISAKWVLQAGRVLFDGDSAWVTLDSGLITQDDSATANVDTTILNSGMRLNYTYYRYAFVGSAANKQGDGVLLSWLVTSIAQPNDYWILGTAADTTPVIWNPAGFNTWTLWYKAQRLDSIKVWMRALVSYDLVSWRQADSINPTSGYIDDSLTHFRILTLPEAMALQFQITGDAGAGESDYDYANGDSSGMRGVLVRLQYIQGR